MRSTLALGLTICGIATGGVAAESNVHLSAPSPTIVRLDPRLDEIVPKDAKLERVAEGISWAEGPVWDRQAGYLLFSDVPNNSILKWEIR